MSVNSWSTLLAPIEEAGVSEAIVHRLSELMTAGVLSAGDRLPPEAELATHFQVAPMTVRNALKVLRDEGFVETHRGRYAGTFVSSDIAEIVMQLTKSAPQLELLAELTTWRKAISGESAALAAKHATVDEISRLSDLVEVADNPSPSFETYRFADAHVHLFIAELSRSQRMIVAEQQIQAELSRLLSSELHQPVLEQTPTQGHGLILEAIRAGDPEQARQRMQQHVQSTLDLTSGTGLRPLKGIAG